jgi:hypothetical protein
MARREYGSLAPIFSSRAGIGRAVSEFRADEAFAVVAMIAARGPGILRWKLNVNTGASAPGHPMVERN